MRNFRTTCILVSILSLCTFSSSSIAQYGMSNARSMGMSGAYTALARGVESASWNPANLGLSGGKTFNLNLVSVGVGIHNNSFSKKHYDLYNGAFLSTQDKQDILSSIPNQGFRGDFDTEVQAMGISIGSVALTAHGLGTSDFMLSKDIFDLALNGNELNRVYNVGATGGEGWGISSFGLSTAFGLGVPGFQEFTVGVSGKYLMGFGYAKVMEAASDLTTTIDAVRGSGRIVIDSARGGSGFAVDIGSAARFNRNWTLSLSLTNAVSNINWNKETERFTYEFSADSISVEKIDDTDIDSLFIDSDESIDIAPFSSKLPAELRIGIARTARMLTFAVDLRQGLKRAPGVSTKPEISLGTELRLLQFLPLRGGLSLGGKRGLSSSVGFGFDLSVLTLDFAVASKGGVVSGRGIGAAFGMMFKL